MNSNRNIVFGRSMRSIIALAFIALTTPSVVSGHGYMARPMATYKDPSTQTSYIYRVDGNIVFPGLKWDDSPQKNSDQLATKINSGQFPDIKTFTNQYIAGCPFNDLSKLINVNHLSIFQWQNDQEMRGFVSSHEGPCEIWIDSTRIFNDTNCARRYTAYPAVIPIDYSVCSGTCQFEFYWITMQEPLWQLYKACAIITHDGTSADQSSTQAPSPPTQAPSPPTQAPVIKLLCSELAP
jgi:hypothetical protein